MITVDSSVAIAAFASWHKFHKQAWQVVLTQPKLTTHAAMETYSVLTRLPAPHRAPASVVARFLTDSFHEDFLALPPNMFRQLINDFARTGIAGGAVYDALIGATAAYAGATLVSCDARASANYRRVSVTVELLS